MTFAVGDLIGAYQIIEQIGQGGWATVYKAYQAALDRHVAMKVINAAFLDDAVFLSRFQREARLIAKLEHPNIIPVYDFAAHEGLPYLVMRFVKGETLKARLMRGLLPLDECARILGGVGAALSYAHRQGVLHCDIKPSNILLDADGGNILLGDFGLARLLATSRLSTNNLVSGTPMYMSPEQSIEGMALDERSDQYTLGVVLYEMVSGTPPFVADVSQGRFGVIQMHLTTPPAPPSVLNVRISPAQDDVILRALSKDSAQRFENVDAFVKAFQKTCAPPRPATAPIRAAEKPETFVFKEALSPEQVSIMLFLQPQGETFTLCGKREYVLGRADPNRGLRPDLDLGSLKGMELGVSRQHGRLAFMEGQLYYADLNSFNGSLVNGAGVYSNNPVPLKDGDEVCLGKMTFRVYFAM